MYHAISTLHGLEAVRKKPGMYIGGTDQRALHDCVLELLANSVEEHLAGRGSLIVVTLHEDGSLSVSDEGGGITTDLDPERQAPFIEVALTTLHFPAGRLPKPFRTFGSLGVGPKCVNAVSEWMRVKTVWNGREHQIGFARGCVQEPLRISTQPVLARGTDIRFKPDSEIFQTTIFDRYSLARTLDSLALLYPGLVLVLEDRRPNAATRPLTSLYHYPDGIKDYLNRLPQGRAGWRYEPLVIEDEANGIRIKLGFRFTEIANASILSFANSLPTVQGGAHEHGLLIGLADGFNALPESTSPLSASECRHGLHAFIAVWLDNPRFGGSTKDKLIKPEVEIAVRELTARGFKEWAATEGNHPKWLRESLIERRKSEADEN